MESTLKDIADFQFDFDAMNLDLNAFPDLPQLDCNFEFPTDSMFELDTSSDGAIDALPSYHGHGTLSAGSTTPESMSSTQPSEPIWTPMVPQLPTQRALPAFASSWKPCSPPLLPVAQFQYEHSKWRPCSPPHTAKPMHAFPSAPLKQFQYPDPQIQSISQPVPYLSLPPRSVPDQGSVSPKRSTPRPTESPTDMITTPIPGLKRRRSIHLEDLYTSDQESALYDSDSSLSSAPPSPSVSSPQHLTRYGVKKGPKHKLEQTKRRQVLNERRRAYYQRVKQDPAWKDRQNALERSYYHKRQAAKHGVRTGAVQAKGSKKVGPGMAETTPEKSTTTSKKLKPKWKGWVVLSDDEEEPSEQSVPNAKKRKLAKEIENTKEFIQSRGQVEESDGDGTADEDDGEEYRITSISQSRRSAASREDGGRRSRRAKQPISYADE